VAISRHAPPDQCLGVACTGHHVPRAGAGRGVRVPLLRRHRRHVGIDLRDNRPGLLEALHLHVRAGEERHGIDHHEWPDEIGMIRGQRHREHAAEAVTDHDRAIEMLPADVFSQLAADGWEERPFDCRCAGESGERQHMTGESSAHVIDRRHPRVA
jgi:hypothetical protein